MTSSGARIEKKTSTYIGKDERIRCLRDHVVVRPLKPKWSPIIETAYKGQHLRGIVTAVGPGTYLNIHERGKKDGKDYRTVRKSRYFTPTDVKVGDEVELGGAEIDGYLFETIMVECKDGLIEHVICREADIAAVHDGSP